MHRVNASVLVWTLLLLFLFVCATHLHNPFPDAYLTLQLTVQVLLVVEAFSDRPRSTFSQLPTGYSASYHWTNLIAIGCLPNLFFFAICIPNRLDNRRG